MQFDNVSGSILPGSLVPMNVLNAVSRGQKLIWPAALQAKDRVPRAPLSQHAIAKTACGCLCGRRTLVAAYTVLHPAKRPDLSNHRLKNGDLRKMTHDVRVVVFSSLTVFDHSTPLLLGHHIS